MGRFSDDPTGGRPSDDSGGFLDIAFGREAYNQQQQRREERFNTDTRDRWEEGETFSEQLVDISDKTTERVKDTTGLPDIPYKLLIGGLLVGLVLWLVRPLLEIGAGVTGG